MIFRHADMAHYQYVRGVISDETLYDFLGPIRGQLGSLEFAREVWREGNKRKDFINYVDEMMQEYQPTDPYWQ